MTTGLAHSRAKKAELCNQAQTRIPPMSLLPWARLSRVLVWSRVVCGRKLPRVRGGSRMDSLPARELEG
jgi:hypothetical protein